ncbi:MAG: serine hydrolase [Nitrospirota bacterium]
MNRPDKTGGGAVRRLIVIALFAGGILTGIVIDRVWTGMGDKQPPLVEKREGGYTFINPLLQCDGAQEIIGDREIKSFQRKIRGYVDAVVNKKRATQVSIYYRDLNNGPSFGVNDHERFAPASLLKVPLMIAYYKMAESRPAVLKEQLVYDGSQDRNKTKFFRASRAIEPGKRYTVDELIEMMTAYSDNNAMFLLLNHLDRTFREKVYQDLGVFDPNASVYDYMSVKEYSSCYRVLFNSSYLNREYSERALRYLAKPDFRDGMVGGLPPGITVAQKYGERSFDDPNIKELHDCGIVYYPNMPYLLCIMTKGADYGVLADTIKEISAIIVTEVDRHQRSLQSNK